MSNQISVITEDNYQQVIDEMDRAFFDIPFENSRFQTENFVIGGSITPERAYRNIGLRMYNRIQALEEARYNLEKENIDIEELQFKINNPQTTNFDKRRYQLDIDFKLRNRPFTAKLINDALAELNVLYAHFNALPKYTREEFEQGELAHFDEKLNRQRVGVQGPMEALTNMEDFGRLTAYMNEYQLLLSKQNT